MLGMVRPQMELDAVERRQHLSVADVEARRAHLCSEAVRRCVCAVREEDERPAGGANPIERFDGAGLHVHRLALPVDEGAVDVEHEALDVVKSHDATPQPRLRPARGDAGPTARFSTSRSRVTTG